MFSQRLSHYEALEHFGRPVLHKTKVLVATWWQATDLIHHIFFAQGGNIPAEKCFGEDKMCQKCFELTCRYQHKRCSHTPLQNLLLVIELW